MHPLQASIYDKNEVLQLHLAYYKILGPQKTVMSMIATIVSFCYPYHALQHLITHFRMR